MPSNTAQPANAEKPEGTTARATAADPATPAPNEATSGVEESRGASKRVSTGYPVKKFVVEDVPDITREGTMLTATQLKTAQKQADVCGVQLVVEGEGN